MYQLRAQGLNIEEIERALPERFPGARTPSDTQIWRWLSDPESAALVKAEETRIRATVTQRTREVIGRVYDGLASAVELQDAKAVDAWSRSVVNLTRGFVQERLEVASASADTPDELASLLARHGVQLEQRVIRPKQSETPAS